ncbi:MAG: hypothetical protein HGB35_02725, partial [Geobacteraceae bacterium]|nr:hypothetical protein [Geobacteraceae bacterium]
MVIQDRQESTNCQYNGGEPVMTESIEQRTLDAYLKSLFDTDKPSALRIVQEALDGGLTPEKVVFDV